MKKVIGVNVPHSKLYFQKEIKPLISFKDIVNAFFGEADSLRRLLTTVNWWYVAACLGFLVAVAHLILINNLELCYQYAQSQAQGFEVTLPEAIAAVEARGWFNLILSPLLFIIAFMISGGLVYRITRLLKGSGSFNDYFGMITMATSVLIMGQFIGYIMIGAWRINELTDLCDLTPGVGLGLLSMFTVERVGIFIRELVRGFDLFGIWLVLLGAAFFKTYCGFSRLKSFCLAFLYYGGFLVLRWFFEGPGYQLLIYLQNPGNI